MLSFLYTLFAGDYVDCSKREKILFLCGMAAFFAFVILLCYLKTTYGADLARWIKANYPYPIP